MTIDQFVVLVHVQWDRGLIVPNDILDNISESVIRDAASFAEANGFITKEPYSMAVPCTCFRLTRAGWARIGELTNSTTHYPGDRHVTY